MSHAPTVEQAAAIESRAGSILLEAGAGTGKTTVLVDRYCDRIELDGLACSQILAFTFTEKAAAQLQSRIGRELEHRAEAAEADGRDSAAHLRAQVHALPGAWVMTIHGFCRRILASHPVAAGLDPNVAVLDEPQAARLRRQAFAEALEGFLDADDDRPGREALVASYGRGRLEGAMRQAHAELRSFGKLHPRLPDPPEVDLIGALTSFEQAAVALAESGVRPAKSDLQFAEALELVRAQAEWLGSTELDASGATRHDAAVAQLAVLGLKNGSTVEVRSDCDNARLHALSCLIASGAGREAYGHMSELFARYSDTYTEIERSRGGVDFDDLQLEAIELLTKTPAGAGYREKFAEVMVDEFQDTSPGQIELINALRGPDTAVFEVGDEFQSIYGFRQADVEGFRAERRRAERAGGGELLSLRGNFRSSSGILAAANVFGRILLRDFRPLTIGSEDQAAAGTGSTVELNVVAYDGWDDEGAALSEPPDGVPPRRWAEAEALAERTAALTDEGFDRSQIVVLLRGLGCASAYAEALERRGMNPFVIGGRGYWSGRDIADAIALLKAVANPLDDEALLGALACPACAVSPDALWHLRQAAGRDREIWAYLEQTAPDAALPEGIEAIDRVGLDRLARFRSTLAELHRRRPLLGLEALVEETVAAFGLDLAVLDSPAGTRRWAALRKLIRMAGEFEAAEGRDLRALIEQGELDAAEDRESEAVTAAEGHDGVRLMTIHAAKGLEFPVVAVPELGRDPSRSGGGGGPLIQLDRDEAGRLRTGLRYRRIGGPDCDLFDYEEIAEGEKARGLEEEMRLFHVAVTRAESRLLLSGTSKLKPVDRPKRSTSILDRILGELGPSDIFDSEPAAGSFEVEIEAAEPRVGLEIDGEPAVVRLSIAVAADGVTRAGEREDPAAGAPSERSAAGGPEADAIAARSEPSESAVTGGSDGPFDLADLTVDLERLAPIQDSSPPYPDLSFTRLSESLAPAADSDADTSDPEHRAAGMASAVTDQAASAAQGADPTGGADDSSREAMAFGSAVHILLERALTAAPARNRWTAPTVAQIEAALLAEGLEGDPGQVERARTMVDGWLDCELCRSTTEPRVLARPEVPLILRLGTEGGPAESSVLVRGVIDLLAEPPEGPPLIVDYKTNRLDGRSPTDVAAKYELQKQIYAVAVARATGANAVQVAYVMLERPEEPIIVEFDAAAITAATDELHSRISTLEFREICAPEIARSCS